MITLTVQRACGCFGCVILATNETGRWLLGLKRNPKSVAAWMHQGPTANDREDMRAALAESFGDKYTC